MRADVEEIIGRLSPQQVREVIDTLLRIERNRSRSLVLSAIAMVEGHLRVLERPDLAELAKRIMDELMKEKG